MTIIVAKINQNDGRSNLQFVIELSALFGARIKIWFIQISIFKKVYLKTSSETSTISEYINVGSKILRLGGKKRNPVSHMIKIFLINSIPPCKTRTCSPLKILAHKPAPGNNNLIWTLRYKISGLDLRKEGFVP